MHWMVLWKIHNRPSRLGLKWGKDKDDTERGPLYVTAAKIQTSSIQIIVKLPNCQIDAAGCQIDSRRETSDVAQK